MMNIFAAVPVTNPSAAVNIGYSDFANTVYMKTAVRYNETKRGGIYEKVVSACDYYCKCIDDYFRFHFIRDLLGIF